MPIELALAVNTSLISLVKLGIYCTEPFRIPFAGKIDICCFDKTGTLTSDDLIVEGVAGLVASTSSSSSSSTMDITSVNELPVDTLHTLATCHTLVNMDDELIGDPLEKVTLQAIDWTLTRGDVVVARTKTAASSKGWKIYQRYHFSSALRRMSVVAGHTKSGAGASAADITYIATCKGAPEVLKAMLRSPPADYDDIYLHYAREGSRVLCLAHKELGTLSHQELRDMKREDVESELTFAGFLIVSCPLKPDTKAVVKEILNSTHHICMITGDNPLTACHVASQLRLIDKKNAIVLSNTLDTEDEWRWTSIASETDEPRPLAYALEQRKYAKQPRASSKNQQQQQQQSESSDKPFYKYLCLTGDGFDYLYKRERRLLKQIIAEVKVFARVSPKQKEYVITVLKSLGYVTLMCGDGTNDVGALKHAEVGVALLSNSDANGGPEFEQHKRAKLTEAQKLSNQVSEATRMTAMTRSNQQSVINAQVNKRLQ